MPTCTELERELLDELSQPKGSGTPLHELRVKICIARLSPELRERLVTAVANSLRWSKEQETAWELVREQGVLCSAPNSVEWKLFYEGVIKDARKRNGEPEPT